jgi:preprotein translocase subunit SecB
MVDVVEFTGVINPEEWKVAYAFRDPIYFEKLNKYIGGLDIQLKLYAETNDAEAETSACEEDDTIKEILHLEAGIVGTFALGENSFSESQIENLVTLQIPSILMPYLRAAVSSFLCSGGWLNAPLPLLNVYEMAKHADITIRKQ